ncbi:MAG: hypothetical protein KAR11_08760 [Phycisphaerae bacterium]|nr:hypothetical protein [Phycisphaerae bacterium]
MKDYDKLIARLTDRLSVDPELQMDVAQELRAHLDDSAAEFREAGLTEEQAETQAAKALGDPDELSGQLWSANRTRLRIRGLLRWTARITLIPAAIGVIVCLLLSMGVRENMFTIPESWADELTEEQMYILRGDPAAETPLEQAKSITDRWPKNPVYFGDYAVWAIAKEKLRGQLSDAKLKRLQELLSKGEKLDPDNAFYNFMRAAALINSTCELKDDELLTYLVINSRGEVQQKPCYTVAIENEKIFRQGLAELRAGLKKPRLAIPSIEMLKIREAIIPKPRNVTDILRRTAIEVSVLLPSLNDYRNLNKAVLGYALAEARKGNSGEALQLVQYLEQFANHTGANSSCLIELLVAHANYNLVMGHAAQMCKVLGEDDLGQEFQARCKESGAFFNELRKRPRGDASELRGAGMYWGLFMPGLPGYTMNFEPMRTAEQFWINEFGLLALLMGLTLLALLMGGVTLLEFLRRSDRPVLMFVGGDRMAKICFYGIVLPIGIYAAYVYFFTIGPDVYGLNVTVGRVILELIFVGAIICVTLVGMSYSAIRRRAVELGLTVPEPLTLRRRWIMWPMAGLLTLGVLAYLTAWWTGHIQPSNRPCWSPYFNDLVGGISNSRFPSPEAIMIGAIIFIFLLIWGVRELVGLFKAPYRQFRRSLYRNIVPILAAAVIVVGIICGFVLNRAETAAAKRVTGNAMMSFATELERCDYREIRDRFAARQAEQKPIGSDE